MRHTRRLLVVAAVLYAATALVPVALAAADAPSDPSTDPSGALNQLWQAIVSKRYGLAAVIATMLFVAFARFIAPRIHGKFGAWVNSTRVSATLALVGGMSSAIAWKLMAGTPWSMNIVVYGFGIGVAAIGGYNAFWDLLFPADKKPPAATTADSAAELAKKTPPAVLVLVLAALAASGCGHADAGTRLRQSCATADLTLTQATLTATSAYRAEHAILRADLQQRHDPATVAYIEKSAAALNDGFRKFITAVKAATAVDNAVCTKAVFAAVDTGLREDADKLIAQALQVVIDIGTAVKAFEDAIDKFTGGGAALLRAVS